MIRILLDNKLNTVIFTTILALALRIPVFVLIPLKPETQINAGILTELLTYLNTMPVLSYWLAFIILVIEGLILNKMVWEQNIIEKPGYIVYFFFLMFNMCFIENMFLSNILVGNLLLLIGLNYFYLYIKNNYHRNWLFLGALFFGITALIVPEHYWILLFLIVAIILFKPILPVDIFAVLFGLIMPYYLVSAVGYIFDFKIHFLNAWQFWVIKKKVIDFHWFKDGSELLLLFILLLFVFLGNSQLIGSYFRSNVETRRSKLALIVFALYLTIIFFIRIRDYSHYFILGSIPYAIFMANYYSQGNWRRSKEIMLYLTMALQIYVVFRNVAVG